jgi:hypothetical protein
MSTEFEIRQVIHTTPERFWERLHRSDEFAHYLYVESLGFGYETLEDDPVRGARRIRIVPSVPAPDAIVKLLGVDFSFVEEGILGDDRVYRFEILPSSLADRISVLGEMRVYAEGESSCVRHMRFTIDANVPGIGGILEKFIERSTRASYVDSHRITNRYLEERSASAAKGRPGASDQP